MSDADCLRPEAASPNDKPNASKVCVRPAWDNSTKLLRIVHNKGPPILYVGSVQELLYSGKCPLTTDHSLADHSNEN